MLHPLEHVGDHQNPLAHTPVLTSCQAPQLRRPRFAAKKVSRHSHPPMMVCSPRSLYHIWRSPEVGMTRRRDENWLTGTGASITATESDRRRADTVALACAFRIPAEGFAVAGFAADLVGATT